MSSEELTGLKTLVLLFSEGSAQTMHPHFSLKACLQGFVYKSYVNLSSDEVNGLRNEVSVVQCSEQ
jgi:hypothetical protein